MIHADFFSSNVDCLKIVKGTLHYIITKEFCYYGSHESVRKIGSQKHDVSGKHRKSSQATPSDPVGFVDFDSPWLCSSVFWMEEQCDVVWKNTDAHRSHGRILLLGEGQADQMSSMRKKPWISAS